jgi:CheY-like chemotaxis protein/HPt (histidine-containing phosphotransfer) domain-containing protein/anti-sigma regulatory factor (Ser/Thr protein kinase)
MSHEIRTPMNAIIGMAELALREEISPAATEMIQSIKSAGNNLLSIINDILDFTKIESGKLEIIETEYLFSSFIQDVIGIIRTRLTEKPIDLFVYVDPKMPNRLKGDEVRIRQILLNLLSNAVKYTKEGLVKLSVTCSPGVKKDYVTFEVVDTGIGIKEENIKDLFSDFTQFDKAANKGIEGTGLGLAITRNLVRLMKGEIKVKSVYGEGSVFTAIIPQTVLDSQPYISVKNPGDKKLLVYEPRETFAESLMASLNDLGLGKVNLVQDPVSFNQELTSSEYNYIFVPTSFYNQAQHVLAATTKGVDGKKPVKLVLMAEKGDILGQESLSTVFMPIFGLTLVSILNDMELAPRQAGGKVSMRFTAPGARVLVVDDIVTNLKVAAGLMMPYGVKVDICESGQEALEKVAENDYDVIFMDHMMPGMDGLEATAAIRAMPGKREVPIVALTANAISGVKEMFLAKGLSDFISKPIDPLKLEEMLFKWIPRAKHVRQFQQVKSLDEQKAAEAPVSSAACLAEPAKPVYAKPVQATSIKPASVLKPASVDDYDEDDDYEEEDPLTAKILAQGVEGVDISEGIERLVGDASLYIEVVEAFVNFTPKVLDQVRKGPDFENLKDYAVAVHGIKGSCFNIGAFEVGKLAEFQEYAAKEGRLQEAIDMHPGFMTSADKLINSFKVLLKKISETEIDEEQSANDQNPQSDLDGPEQAYPPASSDDGSERYDYPPLEILLAIYKASNSFDIKAMDELIAELESHSYETGDELVNWLRQQIDNLEFDSIAKRLGKELEL